MNRSWTIAAASAAAGMAVLSLGLFLAVSKDSLAGDDDKKVKVITVTADGDSDDADVAVEDAEGLAAEAEAQAAAEVHHAKGGYLGLSLGEDTKSDEGGALVERVISGSPADKAGLKSGDVIVGLGGDVVRGPGRLTQKIQSAKPGDKVVLDVRRDGKLQKFSVELGERKVAAWTVRSGGALPMDEEGERALEESLKGLDEKTGDLKKHLRTLKLNAPGMRRLMILGGDKPLLGIEMLETTPELRDVMGGSKDAGVLVGKVLAGSAAEKCGLKVGDLILSVEGEKVSDPGELGEVIARHEGKTIDLDLVRDKRPLHLKAVLPKSDEPEDEPTGPRASVWRLPACVSSAIPLPPSPAAAPAAAPAPPARLASPAPPAPPALPRLSALFV